MAAIETFKGIAHPWLCDVMGHLNTRNYMAMFDDASMHFLAALGYDFKDAQAGEVGWADVRVELDLMAEVPEGGLVIISTSTQTLGNSSLTYVSEMRSANGETLHARATTKTVYFNLKARKSKPIPDAYRQAAEQFRVNE